MNEKQLKTIIQAEELKWMDRITTRLNTLFGNLYLPSHDISHHKRVWQFAREIILLNRQEYKTYSSEFVEALLLSCFFHDTGLTRTFDAIHGKVSRDLAESFLNENPGFENRFTIDLLDAIEKHDDKNYPDNYAAGSFNNIYQILTVSDDLDALGVIGLYRYFEIYFMRKYLPVNVGEAIRSNLILRWNFVKNSLAWLPQYLIKQEKRFKDTISYLNRLTPPDIEKLFDYFENKSSDTDNLITNTKNSGILVEFVNNLNLELKKNLESGATITRGIWE